MTNPDDRAAIEAMVEALAATGDLEPELSAQTALAALYAAYRALVRAAAKLPPRPPEPSDG